MNVHRNMQPLLLIHGEEDENSGTIRIKAKECSVRYEAKVLYPSSLFCRKRVIAIEQEKAFCIAFMKLSNGSRDIA